MLNFSNATTFYVSQTAGSHRYSGFAPAADGNGSGPLQSVEQALDKIRQLRRAGMDQPVSIQLLDPLYTLEKTLVLDAGTPAVTLESFGGRRVRLCGGRRITGFAPATFGGVACLGVHLPAVQSGEWVFTDLYVNGRRAELTRWPETGHLIPEAVETRSGELADGSRWFVPKAGDFPTGIYRPEDMLVSFTHYWVDEHTPVESYDAATGRVTLQYRSRFAVNTDPDSAACMQYWLENLAELFQRPNQWYLDRPNGMLYYIPADPAQPPEELEVFAPVLTTLVSVQGTEEAPAQRIRLRGLELYCSRGDYCSPARWGPDTLPQGPGPAQWRAADAQSACGTPGMVELGFAHACALEDCTLSCFGLTGIVLQAGCSSCRITGCTLQEGGAGGLRIDGSARADAPARHTHHNCAANNTIRRLGRRYLAGCGILLMHSYENEITGNEISDLYYSGISAGWDWGYAATVTRDNRITHNHIHHLGQGVLSDMGGVYLLGRQPGTVVSNNVIHDIQARFYGGWALYTDEGSSYITLENNICYRTSETCYHQHYGCMNTVRNNIFVFSKEYMLKASKPELHLGLVFERNIICCDGVPVYGPDFDDYPGRCIGAHHNLVFDVSAPQPVFFRHADGRTLTLADMQALYNMEEGTIIADPCFADAAHDDFTLRSDSPAFALGFRPIPPLPRR